MSNRFMASSMAPTSAVVRGAPLCVLLLAAAFAPQGASGQVACENLQADGGKFPRWPVQNPGMVAEVGLVWSYPKYTNPLQIQFTGTALAITLPTSYTGGFNLSAPGKPTADDEQYILTRIELRRPAAIPEGAGQVLSHQWEAVLIHKQVNGSYWSNIVVPFAVTTSGSVVDIVNPLIEGAELPTTLGQIVPVMAAATSQLYLDPVFQSTELVNTTFDHFWNTAGCDGCPGTFVNTRYLLRSSTLGIGMDSSQALENALRDVPAQPPLETTGMDVWIVDPCVNATSCVLQPSTDLAEMLTNAKAVQSSAVDEQRDRKKKLDELLPKLENHTGPATRTSIATFQEAVIANTNLKSAVAELNSAGDKVEQVEGWVSQAKDAKWDADKPVPNTTSSSAAGDTTALLLVQNPEAAQPQSDAEVEQPMAMGGAVGDGHVALAQQGRDCSALGRSPIDINSAKVVGPSAVSLGLREPLTFHHMLLQVDAQAPSLRIEHLGQLLRVSSTPGELGWPLGAVLLDGHDRDIEYVDVHVPGQHTIDGRTSAAELQLVHQANGRAVAVAIPLEVKAGAPSVNDWLRPLLKTALPNPFQQKELYGRPLGELHSALGAGATGRYFRYDGTLTTSPCLTAEWYVLQDAGSISASQLATLKSAISAGGQDAAAQRRFPASLVMQGTHSLVTQVGAAGQQSSESLGGLHVHRDHGSLAQTLQTARFRGRRRLQV